jgi:hypothetical protein
LRLTKHFLIFAFLLFFCLGFGPRPTEPGLSVSLFIPQEIYYRGEPVHLTIIAANKSRDTFSSVYSSSQSFDFAVFDQSRKEIWRWSHDKVFAMMVRPFELLPGKDIRFSYTWKQTGNNSQLVPAGKYYVQGWLVLSPRKASPQKQLIVK